MAQASSEDTLRPFWPKKLKQTLTEDARNAKSTKKAMNHSIYEMLLLITKLNLALTDVQDGANRTVEYPKYAKGRYPAYFDICKRYKKLSTCPST